MDEEILNTVHSLLGGDISIVDCEKTSTVAEEEVLLINGVPLKLDGMLESDAAAIKTAFKNGEMPSVELLNELLKQAGLIKQPVQLETSLSVKSSITTKEEVLVSKRGQILDERISETKEDYVLQSHTKEIFQPVLQNEVRGRVKYKPTSVNSSTSRSSFELNEGGNSFPNETPKRTINRDANNSFVSHNLCENDSSSTVTSSSGDDKFHNLSSTISNYSTYACSKQSDENATISDTTIPRAGCAASNLKNFTLSCDSGHDDTLFNAPSHVLSGNSDMYEPSCYDDSFSSVCSNERCENLSHGNKCSARPYALANDNVVYRKPQFDSTACAREIENGDALVYNRDQLTSGLLGNIIRHLVPTSDYYPDKEFLQAFLMCSRRFILPNELIATCSKIWQNQVQKESNIERCVGNAFRLLMEWRNLLPQDFLEKAFLLEVQQWTRKCLEMDQKSHQEGLELIKNVVQMQVEPLDYKDFFPQKFPQIPEISPIHNQLTQKQSDIPSDNVFTEKTSVKVKSKNNCALEICSSSTKLAEYLTAIELEYLSRIKTGPLIDYVVEAIRPEESRPNKPNASELPTNFVDIQGYLDWFDHLKLVVATEIVRTFKKKHRVRVVDLWIETARECFNIGNFNSLMAILAALNSAAVFRLRKTWSKVQSAKFAVLKHQMDPALDFSSYRLTMKAALWRIKSSSNKDRHVVIPYFNLLLQDLCLVMKSCSKRLPNNHINFEKCLNFAKLLSEFVMWRDASCPYEKHQLLTQYLHSDAKCDNEATLLLQSFACEPPVSVQEKDTYKILKSESK